MNAERSTLNPEVMSSLLEVENLTVSFSSRKGKFDAVRDVSFRIGSGEIVGLVGESGCGKSITALSLLRLAPPSGRISGGKIWFEGQDLMQFSERQMQSIRGNKIAIVFQEPMMALNPLMRIGDQVAEGLIHHGKMSTTEGRQEAIRLLKLVRMADAEKRAFDYPFQLSGGMRQRAMIAAAVACQPSLLIADEPTTALDMTIQSEILQLLQSLRNEFDLSILLITHSLGIVAETADRAIVMYAGKIVEEAPVEELFRNPCHPYTQGLLDSIPEIRYEEPKPSRLRTIEGSVADPLHLPPGCSFYDRCKVRMDHCAFSFPPPVCVSEQHSVACYKYEPA